MQVPHYCALTSVPRMRGVRRGVRYAFLPFPTCDYSASTNGSSLGFSPILPVRLLLLGRPCPAPPPLGVVPALFRSAHPSLLVLCSLVLTIGASQVHFCGSVAGFRWMFSSGRNRATIPNCWMSSATPGMRSQCLHFSTYSRSILLTPSCPVSCHRRGCD